MVMASATEQPSSIVSRRLEEPDFNLKEWSLKARISRENTSSRRFSASYIRSFREDASKSFRSNITISSTASSPGYALKEEIDPSTYSFTTAIKSLQAKTVYSWEHMSPEGVALNSKWSEAERYICNPLSGEVPLECLSAKTLSGRSFRQLTSRITMSAPLIYPVHHQTRQFQMKPPLAKPEDEVKFHVQEKKILSMKRDVGIQSTPVDIGSKSPSPAATPSIEERPIKRCSEVESEDSNSPISRENVKFEEEVEMKETKEEEDTKRNEEGEKKKGNNNKQMLLTRWCSSSIRPRQGGCFLSWRSLWMKRKQREKHKPRKKNIFLCHKHGC